MHFLHSGIVKTVIVQLQHIHTYDGQQDDTHHPTETKRDEHMTYSTYTGFAGFSLGQRFAAFRADMAENAAKRKAYRTTLAELESLSNRDLSDLGISRSAIKSVAFEAAYGVQL
jgi:uncharacterized protein YjiS (DUF1127 family)